MKRSRRDFLRSVGAASAAAFTPWPLHAAPASPPPAGILNPRRIPKYITPLVIPPAMPQTSADGGIDHYEIAVRQFTQPILPAGMPATTVWSYGPVNHPESFNYPAFTIEARVGSPVRVKWSNGLVDRHGRYLRHLLPVDPTLHWANPPGPRDMRPEFAHPPARYDGPVPIVTHLHGGNSAEEGDGYPEAWFLPDARNIPSSFFPVGSFYESFKEKFEATWGQTWEAGSFTAHYANSQRATTLWYHDHTLGITRLNVYAGPAGFYLLRGGSSDLPAGVLPAPRQPWVTCPVRATTKFPLSFRTAASVTMVRFFTRIAGVFSMNFRAHTFLGAISRRSGIRSSLPTRSS
jgi:bilirubin oxidase